MEIQDIRNVPVENYLQALGYAPVRKSANELLYHAPYREDRRPSFRVNVAKGLWFDFGLSKGGDIFDLAGEIIGSSDFITQARHIAETLNSPLPMKENNMTLLKKETVHYKMEDVEFIPIWSRLLINYLRERNIPMEVALPNCEEVRYKANGKQYFSLAFKNVSGGYEIRNKFFKGCIPPKDYSLIDNGSKHCNLYEGYFDYLSAVTLGLTNGEDQLVLNSVNTLGRVMDKLGEYEQINCYLDNDNAGRRTVETLRKHFGDKVKDCSGLYKGEKDLNEYLQKLTIEL